MAEYYEEQLLSWTSLVEWLHALPLLHFLRGESKPFEDMICLKPVDCRSYKWWGLEKLPCKEIRKHICERFVLFMHFCKPSIIFLRELKKIIDKIIEKIANND